MTRGASDEGFVVDFLSALRHALPPDWRVERTADGALRFISAAEDEVATEIDSFLRTYKHAESRGRDGLYTAVGEMLVMLRRIQAAPVEPTPADLNRVYPQLHEPEDGDRESGLLLHPLTEGMDVAYGISVSGGLILLTEEQLQPMGVTADGLRAAALRNLRALGVRPQRLSDTIVAFRGGEHPLFNATQVVLEDHMRAITLMIGMRAIDVAVPSHDLALAYLPTEANRAALPLTAELLHHLSDEPLTPRILSWRYSSWDDM